MYFEMFIDFQEVCSVPFVATGMNLTSIKKKLNFILKNDNWFLKTPSFAALEIHVFSAEVIKKKLQSVLVRNYLRENRQFVSWTAGCVERVPGVVYQLMSCIYPYRWLHQMVDCGEYEAI
jgi:hypothetical protein